MHPREELLGLVAVDYGDAAGELKRHCDAMCRFGVDRSVLRKIAKGYELSYSRQGLLRGAVMGVCSAAQ